MNTATRSQNSAVSGQGPSTGCQHSGGSSNRSSSDKNRPLRQAAQWLRVRTFHSPGFASMMLAAILPLSGAYGHDTLAYSHDSGADVERLDWMAVYPASTRINRLSIPGTHETMARYGGDAVACQTKTLDEQLRMGIRAFDIRCAHFANLFFIYHSIVPQQAEFGADVLAVMQSFLASHPSETVFVRVKDEIDLGSNTRYFYQTFDDYRSAYQAVIWTPPNGSYDNPTLGEVRGKIVIMKNFSGGGDYGLDWLSGDKTTGSEGGGIQDWYALSDNWALYDKWTYVKEHLYRARDGGQTNLFINFLSGSGGSSPYFVASGHSSPGTGAPRLATGLTTPGWDSSYPDFPRVDCFAGICTIAFEGTDILTMNLLNASPINRIGMIFIDFPGSGLIEAVIESNRNIVGVVTIPNDSGAGSLRAVIGAGTPTVAFDPNLMNHQTITLTSGNISIGTPPIKISGAGLPGTVRINASHPTRIGP